MTYYGGLIWQIVNVLYLQDTTVVVSYALFDVGNFRIKLCFSMRIVFHFFWYLCLWFPPFYIYKKQLVLRIFDDLLSTIFGHEEPRTYIQSPLFLSAYRLNDSRSRTTNFYV